MGQGKEVKTRPDPKVEIQEKGEVFFFYRPKVDKEEARSPDDVQRMYVVLRPESGERAVEEKQAPDSGKEGKKKQEDGDQGGGSSEGGHGKEEVNIEERPLLRLIVMGKKSCPYWGYVELVSRHHQRPGHQGRSQGRGVQHEDPRRASPSGGEGAGRGCVPHREARRRPRPRAHAPRLQAGAPLAGAARGGRRAAGGHERGAGGVVPHPDQEPRAAPGLRRSRRRRAAEQAQGGVPGAPAGPVREQPVRGGRPAGPAQLRGVRAAAHLGVRRRRGGAGPRAAEGDGGRGRNRAW